MVKCKVCNQEMLTADSCTKKTLIINGKEVERNTVYFDVNKRCHDCGILNKVGNIHHLGCDMERCPVCGVQLIGCRCDKEDRKVEEMTNEECREWMNKYHDLWIKDHNKLVESKLEVSKK